MLNLLNRTHYAFLASQENMDSFWKFALANREVGLYGIPTDDNVRPEAVRALRKIFPDMYSGFPQMSLVIHLRDNQFTYTRAWVQHNPSFTQCELECILGKWAFASI